MRQVVAVAVLHNQAANTWHPILFRDSPLPGGESSQRRVKSIGHHTSGLPSLADAQSYAAQFEGAAVHRDPIPWDGSDVPAMVGFVTGSDLVFF
jgi:hypothetical protein